MRFSKLIIIAAAFVILAVIGGVLYVMSRKPESDIAKLCSAQLSLFQVGFVYLGSSGILLRTRNLVAAIDVGGMLSSGQISDISKLDLLVYTHVHSDHFNIDVAQKIYEATKCLVFAESSVYDSLSGKIPSSKLIKMKGGEVFRVSLAGGDIILRTVPGIHGSNITLVAFEADGLRVFHGGDSGYTPQVALLGPADVAFLPVGGASPTASPDDAAKMALDLRSKMVVLFHGNSDQYNAFLVQVKFILKAEIIVPEIGKLYIKDISS